MKDWLLKKKWRIILAGILVVAVPLVGLALLVDLQVTSALEERITKETGWFSATAARHVEDKLKGDINLGKIFVTRPLLLSGLKNGDKDAMSQHLKILVENYTSLDRAFITTQDGIQLACYPETPETIGVDFSDRDWYKGVSKNWDPYVSEFYIRMASPQRYLFAVAIPMRSDGKVIGILVMQPKTDFMKDVLNTIEIGKGHVYVVDRKGHLVYHSEQAIDRIIDFSGVSIVHKVLNGMHGVEKTIDPLQKKPVISAYHPIKEWGWGVIVDKPVEVVLEPIRKINILIFTISGLMLLLGSFFAYRFSEMLVSVQKISDELAKANEELQVMNEEFQSMNEELQSQQEEISTANAGLAEASKAKSDFLSNMSHELRTPLNSILGFSEILADELFGKLNEKQKEYTKDICSSGRHLLDLINDILDLAKVESGKMELEPSSFLLKDVLAASMSMLKEKAMKHNLNLDLDIQPDTDIEIKADERKLKQIMYNLLSNAVKFTPNGGSVRVSARTAHGSQLMAHSKTDTDSELSAMNYELNGNFIEISVADTGIGIKPEDLSKLFKEFTQLESVYTRQHEGTGLGLALTKKLVELHGGTIWVESEFGRGSRFVFEIPVRPVDLKEKVLALDRETARTPKTGKKALVIEDDPKALALIRNSLLTAGYSVLTALSGKDGVEIAKKERLDLILLDLMMQGMSGFEVVDELRSDEKTASVPVIVLTAMDLSSEEKNRLKNKVQYIAEKGSFAERDFIRMAEIVEERRGGACG